MGERICNATWAMNKESGAAYQGALLDVVINHLCDIAYSFNEIALTKVVNNTVINTRPCIKVNTNMLIRVLLLQHISKADIFVPTTEGWKLKKGLLYEYNPNVETSMKVGERSLFLCQKYGIQIGEDEYDAIRSFDKTEEQFAGSYVTPLSLMVRTANQFACLEMRRQYDLYNKSKQQEIER